MGSTEVWLRQIIEAAISGQPLSIDIAPVTNAITLLNATLSTKIDTTNEDSILALAKLDVIKSAIDLTNTDAVLSLAKLDLLKTAIDAVAANVSPIKKSSSVSFSEILTAAIPANTAARLFAANPNRLGFCIYNNSTNSAYYGPSNSPASARVFGQLASNAGPTALNLFLGPTVWTGEIWVVRNAGTGGVTGYEFLA